MNITFIRGTALGGVGNDAFPGDVRDLPEGQAKQLIALGRAKAGGEIRKPRTAKVEVREATPVADGNTGGE